MNSILDLSYFFNKTNLEIPPPHYLCQIRIWILAFSSMLASADYYDYITKRKAKAMGHASFLIHIVMILEVVLWLKHLDYNKIFAESPSDTMKFIWIIITTFVAALHVYIQFTKCCCNKKRKKSFNINNKTQEKIKVE